MIAVECDECGEVWEVPQSLAGQVEQCPTCGAAVQVPQDVAMPAEGTASPAPGAPVASRVKSPVPSRLAKLPQTVAGHFRARPHVLPAGVTAILLVLASMNCPYDYYRVLRVVVCGVALLIAGHSVAWRNWFAVCLFGVLAVLFNPFMPIELKRATWRIIDPLASMAFLGAALALPAERPRNRLPARKRSFLWWLAVVSVLAAPPVLSVALPLASRTISGLNPPEAAAEYIEVPASDAARIRWRVIGVEWQGDSRRASYNYVPDENGRDETKAKRPEPRSLLDQINRLRGPPPPPTGTDALQKVRLVVYNPLRYDIYVPDWKLSGGDATYITYQQGSWFSGDTPAAHITLEMGCCAITRGDGVDSVRPIRILRRNPKH